MCWNMTKKTKKKTWSIYQCETLRTVFCCVVVPFRLSILTSGLKSQVKNYWCQQKDLSHNSFNLIDVWEENPCQQTSYTAKHINRSGGFIQALEPIKSSKWTKCRYQGNHKSPTTHAGLGHMGTRHIGKWYSFLIDPKILGRIKSEHIFLYFIIL